MIQENLCTIGKQPKILSYTKDNNYIHSICKLKDEITEERLNEFYNTIYNQDLINIFNSILLENNYINLKALCYLIRNNNNKDILKQLIIFFDMLETIKEENISLNNHKAIYTYTLNSNKKFYIEVESIFYNTKVLDFVYYKKIKKKTY